MANRTNTPRPGTLRRRKRQADLAAGLVPVSEQKHGDGYWAKNWGCKCLPCREAERKLNHEQYVARLAAAHERGKTEGD